MTPTITELRHMHVALHYTGACACVLWYVPTRRAVVWSSRTWREKSRTQGLNNPLHPLSLAIKPDRRSASEA